MFSERFHQTFLGIYLRKRKRIWKFPENSNQSFGAFRMGEGKSSSADQWKQMLWETLERTVGHDLVLQ